MFDSSIFFKKIWALKKWCVTKVAHCTCKVKGLTLDYNTSQVIHFDRMLNLVKGKSKGFRETVNYHRIRKHKDKTVTTELQSKTYRFTYTKRVIIGD